MQKAPVYPGLSRLRGGRVRILGRVRPRRFSAEGTPAQFDGGPERQRAGEAAGRIIPPSPPNAESPGYPGLLRLRGGKGENPRQGSTEVLWRRRNAGAQRRRPRASASG